MHEIRNPLEALSNLTYLANQEADHPDKVREYMQLADEQMNTVARIARQTLGKDAAPASVSHSRRESLIAIAARFAYGAAFVPARAERSSEFPSLSTTPYRSA
jgi:hypothetical protein